ncbi:hypothetical protein ACFMQL_19910 [Nonomuraea fastidiosa]|uniref:hypothetical protein n=1 Tax=Nonomuraea TaxID=83681 RepID=UPI00366B55E0
MAQRRLLCAFIRRGCTAKPGALAGRRRRRRTAGGNATGVTPFFAAHSRRWRWISSCGENNRVQEGLSANEYEYTCDGTPHARPG